VLSNAALKTATRRYAAFINRIMKRLIIVFLITIQTSLIFGQRPDSTSKDHFPRQYISINPINTLVLQQAGITYEYRPSFLGFGLSVGGIYPNSINFSRFFMAATSQHGAFEYYHGYFAEPQINIYLSRLKFVENSDLYYLSFKGIYKYLQVDSSKFHIWESDTGGDDYWLYRKQLDKVNVKGLFFEFGYKHIEQHFFIDFNIGPGILVQHHNIVIAGQGTHDIIGSNPSNIRPPKHETLIQGAITVNISFNIGYAF